MSDRLGFGQPASIEMQGISNETMRLILGFDPADPTPSPVYAVVTSREVPPVDPPRKRKGLTGKRYRIARRGYARTMKAWERGLIPGRTISTVGNFRVHSVEPIPGDPGAVSIGMTADPGLPFRGLRLLDRIEDEIASWPEE